MYEDGLRRDRHVEEQVSYGPYPNPQHTIAKINPCDVVPQNLNMSMLPSCSFWLGGNLGRVLDGSSRHRPTTPANPNRSVGPKLAYEPHAISHKKPTRHASYIWRPIGSYDHCSRNSSILHTDGGPQIKNPFLALRWHHYGSTWNLADPVLFKCGWQLRGKSLSRCIVTFGTFTSYSMSRLGSPWNTNVPKSSQAWNVEQ